MSNGWRTLHIYLPPNRTDRHAVVRGPVRDLAKRLRITCTWSNLEHGWLVRQDRIDDLDVLATLEGGWIVRIHPYSREAA